MNTAILTATPILSSDYTGDVKWTITGVNHVKSKPPKGEEKAAKKGDFLKVTLTPSGRDVPKDSVSPSIHIPMSGWVPSFLTFFSERLMDRVFHHDTTEILSSANSTVRTVIRYKVSPFQALRLLGTGVCQRPLDLLRIEEFEKAVQEGEWSNATLISFHERMWLVDGQHRLWASILANLPIIVWIMYGLNDFDVQALDMSKRTSKDQLFISSGLAEKQGRVSVITAKMPPIKDIGAIMTMMFKLHGASPGKVMPTQNLEAAIQEWRPELEWFAAFYAKKSKKNSEGCGEYSHRLKIATVAAAFLVYERRCQNVKGIKSQSATECARKITWGENGRAGTALHRLSHYLTPQETLRARNKTSDRVKDTASDAFWKVLLLLDHDFEGKKPKGEKSEVYRPTDPEALLAKFLGPGVRLLPEALLVECHSDLRQKLRRNAVKDKVRWEDVPEDCDIVLPIAVPKAPVAAPKTPKAPKAPKARPPATVANE